MGRTGNLVLASVVLCCAPILLICLPAPQRFAVDRAGIGAQHPTGQSVADEGSLADVLGRQRVDPRFEPFVERARVRTSMVALGPDTRLIGYESDALGRFCGLLVVDDEGQPLRRRELDGCTSRGPPVLSANDGVATVAWERDHRQVVVSRFGYEIAALQRPSHLGMLSPIVAFEPRPQNRMVLSYGGEVVELSGGGAWPDGPLSRARVAMSTFGRALSLASFLLFAVFALLAERQHRRLRRLSSQPTHAGRVDQEGSARPVLVTRDGLSHGLVLDGAEVFGDLEQTEWLVIGSPIASGEGVYRVGSELTVKTAYAGVTPEAVHVARRNHWWLLALISFAGALAPWIGAAFG